MAHPNCLPLISVADARGRIESGVSLAHTNYLGNYEVCKGIKPTWENITLFDETGVPAGYDLHGFDANYCRVYLRDNVSFLSFDDEGDFYLSQWAQVHLNNIYLTLSANVV